MNFSHSPLISGHSKAWMARALYRCAPPARVVGRRLRQEDTLREGRGGAIVRSGPGAPRGFQIPSCDGRPLAPFQIGTISLNPLIPPNTHRLPPDHPLLSSETNTRLKFHSGLAGPRGSLRASTLASSLIWLKGPKLVRGIVCRCNNQVGLEYLVHSVSRRNK